MSLTDNADFVRLWSAQAVSAFGSRVTRTALPIVAVKVLGEPDSIVALLASVQLAPGVLFAIFAGGMADRGDKRRLLIIADVVRAAVVASLTVAWALGALSISHVMIVGAIVGAASALDQITDVAYLPAIVGPDQLADANAKLGATDSAAEIAGPSVAGLLISAIGAPLAVVTDALGYVWSAVMLARIRARPQVATSSEVKLDLQDLVVGLRAVFDDRYVRSVTLAHMAWSIAGGFFAALYPIYCLRVLGLSEAEFGLVIAMGGVGALGGALLARRLASWFGFGPAIIVASAISLGAGLFIPLASGGSVRVIGLLVAHQLIGDGFAMVFMIHAVTLRQTVLPASVLGRANAAIHVCTMGVLPVAAFVAGVVADLTSTRSAVWVGVVIGLAAPLMLIPLRRLRELPSYGATRSTT